MKNALLLSLALIAVGPVAVEGQTARDFDFANRLLEAQDCSIRQETRELPQQQLCLYLIPGLAFGVVLIGDYTSAVFNIVEVKRPDFAVAFVGNYVTVMETVMENPSTTVVTATVHICAGSKNTGSITTAYQDCR